MKVFKGGLIGCGFFSRHHQAAWSRIPNVEIVAACDLSIERARAAAPRAYTSAEEMLKVEELDFVDIATRSKTHLELISMASGARAGDYLPKAHGARLGNRSPHGGDR